MLAWTIYITFIGVAVLMLLPNLSVSDSIGKPIGLEHAGH